MASAGGAAFLFLIFVALKGFSFNICTLRATRGVKSEAEEAQAELHAEVDGSRQKYRILTGYANECFNTFHAAVWHDLRTLIEDIEIAESSLRLLLEGRRYNDVKLIAEYLLGTLPASDAQELVQRYEDLDSLGGCRRQARDLSLRVVYASMESARKTSGVGINRRRSAKPTLAT